MLTSRKMEPVLVLLLRIMLDGDSDEDVRVMTRTMMMMMMMMVKIRCAAGDVDDNLYDALSQVTNHIHIAYAAIISTKIIC